MTKAERELLAHLTWITINELEGTTVTLPNAKARLLRELLKQIAAESSQ